MIAALVLAVMQLPDGYAEVRAEYPACIRRWSDIFAAQPEPAATVVSAAMGACRDVRIVYDEMLRRYDAKNNLDYSPAQIDAIDKDMRARAFAWVMSHRAHLNMTH